jgi:hypothetical protein
MFTAYLVSKRLPLTSLSTPQAKKEKKKKRAAFSKKKMMSLYFKQYNYRWGGALQEIGLDAHF